MQRETFEIITAQVASLEAKAERVTAEADVRIHKLDLQILKLKLQEAKATLQSTPESGARAGYDRVKRRKGAKVHIAVDTLGYLLASTITLADPGDREQFVALAEEIQQVTGSSVELAYVDQG